ncbi:MAG: indole-3-glycerol phosphate synthase TrpC, partial [Chloroflexota bacterium]
MSLNDIVNATRQRLARERKQGMAVSTLPATPTRDFLGTLVRADFGIIAEIKRASPSKGWLNPDLDVAALARSYTQGGAVALSVLTEPHFFKGSWDDLARAREASPLPILCKDFIFDPSQLYHARSYGADAVLLICALLPESKLINLLQQANDLGLAVLVEVHREEEVAQALKVGAKLIGINNRNLEDFTVDVETTFRLRPLIPPDVIVVSESGLSTPAHLQALRRAGVKAALIG